MNDKITHINDHKPEPTESELTSALMAEYSLDILRRIQAVHGVAMMAQLQIQALQLETLTHLLLEQDLDLVSEYNRRLRVRVRAAMDDLAKKTPAILIPEGSLPPLPP